jgi:hypothetical protein
VELGLAKGFGGGEAAEIAVEGGHEGGGGVVIDLPEAGDDLLGAGVEEGLGEGVEFVAGEGGALGGAAAEDDERRGLQAGDVAEPEDALGGLEGRRPAERGAMVNRAFRQG